MNVKPKCSKVLSNNVEALETHLTKGNITLHLVLLKNIINHVKMVEVTTVMSDYSPNQNCLRSS